MNRIVSIKSFSVRDWAIVWALLICCTIVSDYPTDWQQIKKRVAKAGSAAAENAQLSLIYFTINKITIT
jgi:hypothetical protein